MIETKKQTNLLTNKQTKNIVLDPIYLSQIKSDLHKTFRETSYGCPMMNKTKNQSNPLTKIQTNKQKHHFRS